MWRGVVTRACSMIDFLLSKPKKTYYFMGLFYFIFRYNAQPYLLVKANGWVEHITFFN
jgi:hypothetical protein